MSPYKLIKYLTLQIRQLNFNLMLKRGAFGTKPAPHGGIKMKNSKFYYFVGVAAVALVGSITLQAALRDNGMESGEVAETSELQEEELDRAKAALENMDAYGYASESRAPQRRVRKARTRPILKGDESFIAGPEWEFDGFVVGGQGQQVRSMFVVNDLIYLNVGYTHGFEPGDRLGVYKRGDRIRDPQSGRFLGFEVQQIGVAEITNKIDDETCSVRVVKSNTGIEVGDLVRRDE
jgi:hypothetical protein